MFVVGCCWQLSVVSFVQLSLAAASVSFQPVVAVFSRFLF